MASENHYLQRPKVVCILWLFPQKLKGQAHTRNHTLNHNFTPIHYCEHVEPIVFVQKCRTIVSRKTLFDPICTEVM